jgi:hypothetical protein
VAYDGEIWGVDGRGAQRRGELVGRESESESGVERRVFHRISSVCVGLSINLSFSDLQAHIDKELVLSIKCAFFKLIS